MDDCLRSVTLPSLRFRNKRMCQEQVKSRTKSLYEDTTNIGVRMLAKLGWSEGKGLGKLEDGIQDPIQLKQNRESKGMGFIGKLDDEWTQHDAQFNALLNRLNGVEGDVSTESNVELDPKANLQSLEEHSKKSRARVHYKKFTRGKDLSQVNDKDLANIFGKRSLAEVNKAPEATEEDASRAESEEEIEPERPIMGLSTIKSNLSYQEYFKQKMVQKQSTAEPASEEPCLSDLGKAKKKKSKKNRSEVGVEDHSMSPEAVSRAEGEAEEQPERPIMGLTTIKSNLSYQEYFKQKMMQKQSTSEPASEEPCLSDSGKSKKKKSKKDRTEIEQECQPMSAEEVSAAEIKPKKAKRKRQEVVETEETNSMEAMEAESLEVPKKKKKSKKQDPENEVSVSVEDVEVLQDDLAVVENGITEKLRKKKNSKKNKQDLEEEIVDEMVPNDSHVDVTNEMNEVASVSKKSKKSKKNKGEKSSSEVETNSNSDAQQGKDECHETDGKDNTADTLPQADSAECLEAEEPTCKLD
ncbi:PIN2/TERF1-interacting telomerase inhibitor 1 [Anopheles nili]|uniref:PIN2/TERF1-interacting telomerase inhibitor 1 n=1 Tax=Anopheles nili TaxID=185578 RepID=UPI00237A6151|nr:PIN2/TERF1-interacting telomerase inhibitor 1 [Anopheles nili]